MGLNYYASSPTVVLPPQQPSGYFDNLIDARSISPNSCGMSRRYPVPPSLNYLASVNNSAAGRKRSIADVEPDDLPADCSTAIQQPPPQPKPEPIYGPGMTIIYPNDPGLNIAAESQTGTWAEENHTETEKDDTARPIAVSRKSQRMNSSRSNSELFSRSVPESIIDEKGNTIDHLITALGIGWKNIMTNPDQKVCAKAYARVIENHFPLTDVTIMLQSEALSAYLVRASEDGVVKYWLFNDSLRWCQLLSATLQGAVNNLQAGPVPAVEGPIINSTPRTPPTEPISAVVTNDVEMASENYIGLASAPAVLPIHFDRMLM